MKQLNTVPNKGRFDRISDAINHNFLLLNNDLEEIRLATSKSKGMFSTADALTTKYPKPLDGDWAFVGTGFPCQVYTANNGSWSQTGTYSGDNVSLNDYVLKTDHDDDIDALEEEIQDIKDEIYGESHELDTLTFTAENQTKAVQTNGSASTIPSGAIVYLEGDITSLKGHAGSSPSAYQTLTNGTVTDRVVNYVTCSSTTGDVTITWKKPVGIVNDVAQVKEATSDFENKLRGVGNNASAYKYPILHLGDVADINGANELLETAFSSTDVKYQGRLRMTSNGMVIYVEQYAINYSIGWWAQVAYGMVAPSQDGVELVKSLDKPHIVWRMATVDIDSTTNKPKWHDFGNSISLKTINGNSLLGEGNITIGESEQITVDGTLDGTSDNAVSNKVVKTQVYDVLSEAIQQVMGEKDVKTIDNWGTVPSAADNDVYAYDSTYKQLYHRESGHWNQVELSRHALYIKASDNTEWRWTGTDMEKIGGGSSIDTVDTVVSGNYNAVTSNAVANAMRQYGIDEVAIAKCWSDDYTDYNGWEDGDYWYDPVEDELWRMVSSHDQEFEKVERPIILLKKPDYDVWVWNTQTAKKIEVTTENVVNNTTALSNNPPTTKAVYQALQNIEVPIEEEVEDEKLYPEYYANGNLPDGINYYEWPFRCFRMPNDGETITAGSISNDVYSLCVWAPDQLIAVPNSQKASNPHSYIPEVNNVAQPTSEDVVYYAAGNCFLLKVGTTYYKKWGYTGNDDTPEGSSRDYQSDAGVIRTDTVFCDVKVASEGRQQGTDKLLYTVRDRTSYVMKNGVLTDIESTMTDFTQPILDCLKANNGSMRLHKGKIYFMHNFTLDDNGYSSSASSNPFYGAKNFTVDGNGATLFVSRVGKGRCYVTSGGADDSTASLFTLYNAYNGEIRNLKIMAMPNRDCGAPGGHYRLSSSCSGLILFTLHWDTIHSATVRESNIRFKNIKTQWMYEDFNMKGGVGVSIEGFRSYAACQNAIHYAVNLKVSDSHWVMHPYGGDGMHLIYAQTLCRGLFFEKCSFIQPTEYNSVMISAHGGLAKGNQPRGLYFTNCYFEGGQMLVVSSNDWVFEGCTFRQTLQHQIGNDHEYTSPSSIMYDASPEFVDITLRYCHVVLNGMKLYNGGDTDLYARFLLDNCYIVNISNETVTENLIAKTGKHVYARNTFIHGWPYANLGFTGEATQSADPNAIRITTGFADFDFVSRWNMMKLDRILYGVTPLKDWMKVNYTWASFFEEDVERENNILYRNNPTLGEIRNDADALISYQCIEEGTRGATRIYLESFDAGTESSQGAGDNGVISEKEVTLKLSDVETVTVTVDGQFRTSDALYAELKALFEAKGYTVDNAPTTGLIIHQKYRYDNSTAAVSQTIPKVASSTNPQRAYCTIKKTNEVDGVTPTWRVKSDGTAEELATFSERLSGIRETLYGDVADYIEVADVASLPNDVDAGQLAKVGDDFYICTAEGTRAALPILVGTPTEPISGTIKLFLNPDNPSEFVNVSIPRESADVSDRSTSYDIRSDIYAAVGDSGMSSEMKLFTDKNYIWIQLKQRGKVKYSSGYTFGINEVSLSPAGALTTLKISGGASWGRFSSGSNATWTLYDADTGIVGEVNQNKNDIAEIKNNKYRIPQIALWNDNYQQRANWSVGDLWYSPTNRELKICVSEQVEFEDASPCVAANSESLYFWTGQTMYSLTATEV